ncbi:MAG: hypothetical protein ACI4EV_06170 [Lachnospiraceae bacterium]
MEEIINYHNDIVSEHRERMLNLKKYYPFFQVISSDFGQFREGRYAYLDMGFIVMAVLRFFIEENNFHERDVTYPRYVAFVTECLKKDFGVYETEEDYKEIADYVFDRLMNDGKPFTFTYYDPVDKKKRTSRLRIIESRIADHTVWYTISAEAVEFYLDTKEIRSESRISVQQMLLEKMIKAQDFKGGTVVIDRINSEVNRLLAQKNTVLAMLAADVKGGIQAYEDFASNGMKWFEDEQRLFNKNRELIDKALAKAEAGDGEGAGKGYYRTIKDIFELETQLKIAMNKHSQLLSACTDMSKRVDEIVRKTKLSRLRSHFDFKGALHTIIEKDDATILEKLLMPVMKPKVVKSFSLYWLDDAVTMKPERFEEKEEEVVEESVDIKFDDEIEDARIGENYGFLMRALVHQLEEKNEVHLKEWMEFLKEHYGEKILENGDFYSFMIHMCQKKKYVFGGEKPENESFFDEIMEKNFAYDGRFAFEIVPINDGEIIEIGDFARISDIIIRRVE